MLFLWRWLMWYDDIMHTLWCDMMYAMVDVIQRSMPWLMWYNIAHLAHLGHMCYDVHLWPKLDLAMWHHFTPCRVIGNGSSRSNAYCLYISVYLLFCAYSLLSAYSLAFTYGRNFVTRVSFGTYASVHNGNPYTANKTQGECSSNGCQWKDKSTHK